MVIGLSTLTPTYLLVLVWGGYRRCVQRLLTEAASDYPGNHRYCWNHDVWAEVSARITACGCQRGCQTRQNRGRLDRWNRGSELNSVWLPGLDSHQDWRIQSPLSYH